MCIRDSSSEVLPDHLGLFAQSAAKDRNDEIYKQDFSKVIDAKNALIKNDNLSAVDAQAEMILYADSKDIDTNNLRLIQLDQIQDDGTWKQLPFQVKRIDGKPSMKRMRFAEPPATGKYAFALLDTYFNEGNHKFWAFQVKNSPKSDNGASLQASSIAVKPTPPPVAAASAARPTG